MIDSIENFEKKLVSSVGLNDAQVIQHDLVLKYHLYLELTVVQLLQKFLEDASKIEKFTFSNKLKVLESVGFFKGKPLLLEKIKIISRIRNRFAHNINAKITKQDIKKLKSKSRLLEKILNDFINKLKSKEAFSFGDDEPQKSMYENMSSSELNNSYFSILVGILINQLRKHLQKEEIR